jgi:uncharacterized protein YdaU (DUF1376 family)
MNFYKRYPGDYMGKTAHLSLIEHGAYNVLLDHVYSNESPLPKDPDACYRIARAFTKDERAAVDSILKQYFILNDNGYTNNRVQKELDRATEQADKNKANGKRGGRPKQTETKPKDNPSGLLEQTQVDSQNKAIPDYQTTRLPDATDPDTQKPDNQTPTGKALVPQATRFDEFWQLYPVRKDKKKSLEIWKRRKLDQYAEAILFDLGQRPTMDRQWIDGYIPLPTTYLNRDRWEDEYTVKQDGYSKFLEGFTHESI